MTDARTIEGDATADTHRPLNLMNILGHNIGVCSWSLQPAGLEDLVAKVKQLGLSHLQLAVGEFASLPDADQDRAIGLINDSGLTVTATMVSYPGEDYGSINAVRRTGGLLPDELWPERERLTLAAAAFTAKLGVTKISTHIGFIPPPSHRDYETIVGRIGSLAKPLADLKIDLLMETGQEPASELLQFLNNLNVRNFGINFDPANMLLYGSGDPIDAIQVLGRHIRHVHVKDAVKSKNPGIDWGEEVPFGDGQVPHEAYLGALKAINYTGPLVIEREAGDDRMGDVAYAIETLQELAAE